MHMIICDYSPHGYFQIIGCILTYTTRVQTEKWKLKLTKNTEKYKTQETIRNTIFFNMKYLKQSIKY